MYAVVGLGRRKVLLWSKSLVMNRCHKQWIIWRLQTYSSPHNFFPPHHPFPSWDSFTLANLYLSRWPLDNSQAWFNLFYALHEVWRIEMFSHFTQLHNVIHWIWLVFMQPADKVSTRHAALLAIKLMRESSDNDLAGYSPVDRTTDATELFIDKSISCCLSNDTNK